MGYSQSSTSTLDHQGEHISNKLFETWPHVHPPNGL